jgi:hypothetical protein
MHLRSLLLLALLLPALSASAATYVFPPDSGVVNVRDFGAKGDGAADDTKALRDAIDHALRRDTRYGEPVFIYVPRGTYRVTDTLEGRIYNHGWSFGWRAGFMLVGESRTGTIIKLSDHAPGFTSAGTWKAVIKTGSEGTANADGPGNQAFRHNIMNLTVDTGRGNGGAIGIDYLANNRGCIEEVTIRSGDGAGRAGISMTRYGPGPALIKHVEVVGFDHAVVTAHYEYGMTFEHFTVRNQRVSGIRSEQAPLHMRRFTSANSVPAIVIASREGHLTLIDASMTGGASQRAAIENRGTMYGRDLSSSGYGQIIRDDSGQNRSIPGGRILEYKNAAANSLFPSPPMSLGLPIEETPLYENNDFARWANVKAYGATPFKGSDDDAPAIQAAIDSGREVLFLPNGSYHIGSTLEIRGNVRKIIGTQASLIPRSGFAGPVVRFSTGHTVVCEHIWFDGAVSNHGSGTIAFRHCDIDGWYSNTGGGKVFAEDVIGKFRIAGPQRFWARQLNSEFGGDPMLQIESGATAWVLGYKTEGEAAAVRIRGGTMELLGSLFYPLNVPAAGTPAILNDGGSFSGTFTVTGTKRYPLAVRETRDGVTRELADRGRNETLYTGFRGVSDGIYRITARHSGKVLDVSGGASAQQNGANVQQWEYYGGTNQQWIVTMLGAGAYRIAALHSGKVLDVSGGPGAQQNGANVQQWSDLGATNQQWLLTDVDGGHFRVTARHSGKCLDVEGISTATGANVFQYSYNGTDNQRWRFEKLGSALAAGGIYELEPQCAPGKRLDVSGGSSANGANVQSWERNGNAAQRWKAFSLASGLWSFEPQCALGNRLDVSGAASANGTNVVSWTDTGNAAQKFKAIVADTDFLELEPQCAPGKRLDVNAGSSANGANVQIWEALGGGAQKWRPIRIH